MVYLYPPQRQHLSIFSMKKTHKYQALINRLSRAEGQIHALKTALEEDRVTDCKAFISQIKAARSALKHTSEQFVLHHIHTCQSLDSTERDEQIAEAIKVLASD